MSHEILIQDLRRKSAKRIAEIRHQAEQNAKAIRSEKELEFDEIQRTLMRQLDELGHNVAQSTVRKAEKIALKILDDAQRGLADRLFLLAVQQLGQVRQNDYEGMFAELIAELPDVAWEKVTVNPLDAERAYAKFPGAKVVKDSDMIGGFEVESDNGQYRVVSTLKRRLEKAWPFVLPLLLKDIEEESNAHHAG